MLKQELRRYYLERRRSLSPQQVEAFSLAIANKLLSLPIWSFEYYHIFLQIARQKEVNTQPILSILYGRDKSVVIPKVSSSNHFTSFLLTDGTRLIKNRWGIPEPADGLEVPAEKIDVVFVPLLAFDRGGHRVGYGKGFYDSFLKDCREGVVKIGLSFFGAEATIDDLHEADRAMDYCVTPEEVYKF